MPIYEYRRPDGSKFEVLQSFSEPPLTHDPDTGVPVERVFHAPALHFKGKGFYNTDYGTRKRQREMAASTEGSSPPASNGASGGDDSPSAGQDAKAKPAKGTKDSEKSGGADKVAAKT
jgi:putative FmdB family regulatory protein